MPADLTREGLAARVWMRDRHVTGWSDDLTEERGRSEGHPYILEDRAALAASPEVQALIRKAEARGMERAAQIAAKSAAGAKEDPGTGWASHSWLMTVCRILQAEAAAIRGEGK